MQDLLDLDLEEQQLIDSLAIDLWTLRTATEDFGSTMRISRVIMIVLGFFEIKSGASVGAWGAQVPYPQELHWRSPFLGESIQLSY